MFFEVAFLEGALSIFGEVGAKRAQIIILTRKFLPFFEIRVNFNFAEQELFRNGTLYCRWNTRSGETTQKNGKYA